MSGLALRLLLLALSLCLMACDEGDTSTGGEDSLPVLILEDHTPGLLLTWIDERGGTHTGTTIAEVPQGSRGLVRVIPTDSGHGALLYVADLEKKDAEGRYSVRTMKRSEWEAIIEERREAWRLAHAPPPRPEATATAKSPDAPGTVEGLRVVVYGAAWCKPCHEAAAYLKSKGARVVEYDIEKEPDRAKEMQRKLRGAGMAGGSIPVIDVGGAILRGFSPAALDKALQQAAERGEQL